MHRASLLFAVSPLFVCVACTGAVGDTEGAQDGAIDQDGTSNGNDSANGGDSGTSSSDTRSSGADTNNVTPPTDSGSSSSTDTATPPPVDTGSGVDTSTGDPVADARVVCLDEINKYRATLSLPPYAGWSAINSCVDGEAKKDSESGVAHSAFGSCGESAQNECPGWPGPPDSMIKGCLAEMWAEGPGSDFSTHGHYINMSSTSYSAVSCGFYQTPSGSWWGAQDFQ